jgi:hypothetical protein
MKATKKQVIAFREALRHLWNGSFLPLKEDLRFGTCQEYFEQIERLLFAALVVETLGLKFDVNEFGKVPVSGLRMRPNSDGAPALINRCSPASGYWDHPVRSLSKKTELAFLSFFDWDEYRVRDCAYYRAQILSCPEHPDLIGREVLIEFLYLDFVSPG